MNFFNQYPYININDLNLDFILNAIKELHNEVTNFVSINAIKYADPIQWDITRQYKKNTIVIDAITGTAYISVKPVPMGIALSDTEFWCVVFDLGRFITLASQNFANSYESVLTTTATMPTNQGEWVVWNSILYEALNDIHIGDRYVENGNIRKTTVEEFYNRLIEKINQEIADRTEEVTILEGYINTEIQNRQNADTSIQNALDAEIQNRQNADTSIQNALDGEILNRENGDTTLQNNINNISEHINNVVDPALNSLNFDTNRKFVIIGDSYLNYPTPASGYGQLIKDFTGLNEGENIFTEGTPGASFGGYIDTYLNGLTNVSARITDKNAITDIVLIGGINDRNTSAADFNAGANAFYAYARTNYPNAKIHFMCIGWCALTGQTGAFYNNAVAQYKAFAAMNVNVDYIDNSEYIFTQYSLLDTDKVHPTAAGSIIIARGIANWIKSGGVYIERATALSVYAHTASIITSGDVAFREYSECDKTLMFSGGATIEFNTNINAGVVPIGTNSTPQFVFGDSSYCTINAPCILTIGSDLVFSTETFYIGDGVLYWINKHYNVTKLEVGQSITILPKRIS